MENIKGTENSLNGNKDIFGNMSPFNNDHIWPASKGGTDSKINIMKLSKISNDEKMDLSSGEINGIRFSIEREMTKKNANGEQSIYGRMYIKKEDGWYEVVNG